MLETEDREPFLKEISSKVNPTFAIVKAMEELSELSTVLAQYLTKPDRITAAYVLPELVDVQIQLEQLIVLLGFNAKELAAVRHHKIGKLMEYSATIKGFGHLRKEEQK